jgi:hypothetical protein
MPRGYDRVLYILPFDHRGSFQTKMFGWKSPLSEAIAAQVPGFIGFAVGRTVLGEPPVAWRSKKATREQTSPRSPSAIASSSICLSEQTRVCLLNSQIAPTRDITPQRRPDTCS